MKTGHESLAWVLWLVCVGMGAYFAIQPPVLTLPLPNGAGTVWVWRSELLHAWRALFVFAQVALPVCFLLSRRLAGSDSVGSLLQSLSPLAAMSLVGAVAMLDDLLPAGVASNMRFFAPAALCSWTLVRLWPEPVEKKRHAPRAWLALLLLPAWLLYSGTCYYSAKVVGASGGDECVYIMMMDSLYHDHSLDMQRAWARHYRLSDPEDVVPQGHMHLAENARDDRWYSWHPFGLPLLLAPLWPFGSEAVAGRSIGMGLIAALGCAGLWLLCKRLGASDQATWIGLVLMCGSVYWISFSSRVLAEIPGAVLLIWLFWAIAAAKERPWTALTVASFAAVYSAFMHLRFLPLGLLGAGFFGLALLTEKCEWRRKMPRLILYGSLLLAGYGAWFAIQRYMYSGPSQPVGEALWSFPQGSFLILLDRYGAGAGTLALYGLIAAQFVWWRSDRDSRLLQITVAATFISCAVLNCTNIWPFVSTWDSTPGRYLFAVVPLLVPGLAVTLTRGSRLAVGFFSFLAFSGLVLSITYFALLLHVDCPGRFLVHPLLCLTRQPSSLGYFMPFAAFYENSTLVARLATLVFVACMCGTSYVVLTPQKRRWSGWIAICVTLSAAVFAHAAQSMKRSFGPHDLASALARMDRRQVKMAASSQSRATIRKLLANPLRVSCSGKNGEMILTTSPRDSLCRDGVLSLPRLTDDNDWSGRPLRWATLVEPFRPSPGDWLLKIRGAVTGKVERVRFAVREGAYTLSEAVLPPDIRQWRAEVTVEGGRGDLYLLGLIEGDGAIRIESIEWLPWSRNWSETDVIGL